MTIFYLVRHGETEWNATGRWQGHADVPLNDVGYAQARRLAERFRSEGMRFDAIYSSDLARAWETALPCAEVLGLDVVAMPALREIDVGSWSGLTGAEVAERDGETLARIESGEDLPRGGAERFADLYNRVVAAVEQLAEQHPSSTLLLVTHGGDVRALLLHAAREQLHPATRPRHVGNTSITVIVKHADGWEIRTVNDLAHLTAGPPAPGLLADAPDDAERPL
jgi:probable phosphoglycerate mutase